MMPELQIISIPMHILLRLYSRSRVDHIVPGQIAYPLGDITAITDDESYESVTCEVLHVIQKPIYDLTEDELADANVDSWTKLVKQFKVKWPDVDHNSPCTAIQLRLVPTRKQS